MAGMVEYKNVFSDLVLEELEVSLISYITWKFHFWGKSIKLYYNSNHHLGLLKQDVELFILEYS